MDIEISCLNLGPHGYLSWCGIGNILIWVGGRLYLTDHRRQYLTHKNIEWIFWCQFTSPHCTPLCSPSLEYFSIVTCDATVVTIYFPHGGPQCCCFTLAHYRGSCHWFFLWGISLSWFWFIQYWNSLWEYMWNVLMFPVCTRARLLRPTPMFTGLYLKGYSFHPYLLFSHF